MAGIMLADFYLIRRRRNYDLEAEDLFQRHERSPCVGRSLGVRIPGVPERGDAVFNGKKMTPGSAGRLVRTAD